VFDLKIVKIVRFILIVIFRVENSKGMVSFKRNQGVVNIIFLTDCKDYFDKNIDNI